MLEVIRKEVESMSIAGLTGALYIFGSSTYKKEPSDVDLLLVINESIVSTKMAYGLVKPMVDSLREVTELPIDLMILTRAENAKSGFVDLVAARLIHEFTDGVA
jgi:predicted nucleotidyltransferase